MAAILAASACGTRDAHINSAVTLAFAIVSGNYAKLLPYAIAQMLGAFVGPVLATK